MAVTEFEIYHDFRLLQVSVGEFARKKMPRSISELRAVCRDWYVFRCLSISSSETPIALIYVGIVRVPSKTSQNPQQSANITVLDRRVQFLWKLRWAYHWDLGPHLQRYLGAGCRDLFPPRERFRRRKHGTCWSGRGIR